MFLRQTAGIALSVLVLCLSSAACSPDSSAEPGPTPSAIAVVTSVPGSPSSVTVSDAVPSLDDLRKLGLGDEAAQCFIDTIDPNNTGKVETAEAFMEAWASCL